MGPCGVRAPNFGHGQDHDEQQMQDDALPLRAVHHAWRRTGRNRSRGERGLSQTRSEPPLPSPERFGGVFCTHFPLRFRARAIRPSKRPSHDRIRRYRSLPPPTPSPSPPKDWPAGSRKRARCGRLALPLMVTQLAQMAIMTTDIVMLGRLIKHRAGLGHAGQHGVLLHLADRLRPGLGGVADDRACAGRQSRTIARACATSRAWACGRC